jgi:hypothetical protein
MSVSENSIHPVAADGRRLTLLAKAASLQRDLSLLTSAATTFQIRSMITDINSEDRLVQKTFADHLHDVLGWESIYVHNDETFGPNGTLGRASEREAVLVRDRHDRRDLLLPR